MTPKEIAETELIPIAERAGYEVVEVRFEKSYGTDELTVFIYRKEGITLDDCVKVNDLFETTLDQLDFNGKAAYNLNISSPGLDRPIVTADDFRRNEGEEVELVFRLPQKKKEKTVGTLIALSESDVTICVGEKEKTFPREQLTKIQRHIKF